MPEIPFLSAARGLFAVDAGPMSVRYRLDEDAIGDIARVAEWYDHHAPGLGRILIEEVARVRERLVRTPVAFYPANPTSI